jgi:uncharacterized protein
MHGLVERNAAPVILKDLKNFPVVAILGPRQCGKSTLAKMLEDKIKGFLHLDLESPSDLRKLDDPELFFEVNRGKTVCLDEIQLRPDLFPVLRSIVDRTNRNGQILILGSASRTLIRQGSESLAGRISFIELTPFIVPEIEGMRSYTEGRFWFRGGYPESYLAPDDSVSDKWRRNFLRTFIERDLPQLGFRVTAINLRRLLTMCAHSQGQLLNSSKLAASLGFSYHTVRDYVDLFEQTYLVRALKPYEANIKKRIVKSPKIYIRDSGILHTLLEIPDFNALMGHPVFGSSWEGFALENILAAMEGWNGFFYRTSSGNEIDLILEKGRRRIAVEFKASKAPVLTKGFWSALEDLNIKESWIISPIKGSYPIRDGVNVSGLNHFISFQKKQ